MTNIRLIWLKTMDMLGRVRRLYKEDWVPEVRCDNISGRYGDTTIEEV
jgi:hypothetical protein